MEVYEGYVGAISLSAYKPQDLTEHKVDLPPNSTVMTRLN
jgi:hypothetical protein